MNNKKHRIRLLGPLLITLSLLTAQKAIADVDTREGSYVAHWLDKIGTESDPTYVIDRHYRSRSHYRGIFGYRWCSSFDTKFANSPRIGVNASPAFCSGQSPEVAMVSKIVLTQATSDTWQAIDSLGRRLVFTLNLDNSLLKSIVRDDGMGIEFVYKNDTLIEILPINLARVLGQKISPIKTYVYDLSRNLVKISALGQIQYQIDYDLVFDRVLKIKDKLGCSDTFEYASGPTQNAQSSQTTIHQRLCSGVVVQRERFEFTQARPNGSNLMRLIKLRIVDSLNPNQSTIKEVVYD